MSDFYQDDDKKLWDNESKYPEGFVPFEEAFKHLFPKINELMILGGLKHGFGSYKNHDNPSMQHEACCNSLFHHLADIYAGKTEDKDSKMLPHYHVLLRITMLLDGVESGLPGRTPND